MADKSFDEALTALLEVAGRQRGMTPSADLRQALNALAQHPGRDAAKVAQALPGVSSPSGAGILAVWLGAGVEGGRDPELTCRPIVETFLRWSRTVETPPVEDEDEDGEFGEETDEQGGDDYPGLDEETAAGLQLLGQALVAHLSRSPDLLKWVADSAEIFDEFERVEHVSPGAAWVMHLLMQRSGELVVLDIAQRKGFRVRYDNISNCFHLFTLLQGALASLIPEAERSSEDLLEIARGNSQGDGYDRSWWHYGQPSCPTADIGASIWGEMGPDGIESVDGVQVLLLWPAILESRVWDAGFFSPVLHAALPNVEMIGELPPAEVEGWWARLKLPTA